MRTRQILFTLVCIVCLSNFGQGQISKRKTTNFKTTSGVKIIGEKGFLTVPEKRGDSLSRDLNIKYVHLKSLAENPEAPVVYIEGGGAASTWQTDSPSDLNDWLEILEVSDLIFFDQRGSNNDPELTYIWTEEYPLEFLVSKNVAYQHYERLTQLAQTAFKQRTVKPSGYTIVSHAQDIYDLTKALSIDKYSIFGFSFGSSIGMAHLQLYPEGVEKAIFVGADAPHQSFNYPKDLDLHIKKVSEMVAKDEIIGKQILNLEQLIINVLAQLDKEPAIVEVINPLTNKKLNLPIGRFGLSLILRLDIDDANDIPAIPRLIYQISQKNYDMLQWFAQKRMINALGVSGNGIYQGLASGVTEKRWSQIEKEATESIYGNVVNFPFSAAKEAWPTEPLQIKPFETFTTNTPTLFISGLLDCRTPVQQTEEIKEGFSNSVHIKVENAGHEQAMWAADTFDQSIPAFLRGKTVDKLLDNYGAIEFIPLTGPSDKHPSIKNLD